MPDKKNSNLVCVDNSSAKGEYHTISMGIWAEYKSIPRAPEIIRMPEEYINRELRIYANIITVEGTDDSGFRKKEHKLNKGHWQDIRKSKKYDIGKPFIVTKGRFIRLPVVCKDKMVRIYVEKKNINKEEVKDHDATSSDIEEVSG